MSLIIPDTQFATQQWFALRVRSNCENLIAVALRGKGYAEFFPVYRKRSRWSDRMKQIELPLFPGYVFARFDVDRRLPILTIPGVMHVVGVGKRPEPIEEAELRAVECFIASGLPVEPWPYLRTGQVVEVDQGSLSGMKGILLEIKNAYRLVVSLTLLHRSVAVEIDRDCVRPISSAALALSASD